MAVFELPLRADLTRFDFITVLDGVSYKFQFSWNSRDSGWYMYLWLEDETPICLGVRVVVDWPLGKRSKNPLAPAGMLMAIDSAQGKTNPGLNDLGNRVRILYFDQAELVAMQARLLAGIRA